MTTYVPALSLLLNSPAYVLALAVSGLVVLLMFVVLVLVKMPRDAEWGELRLGRLTARWGRKRAR